MVEGVPKMTQIKRSVGVLAEPDLENLKKSYLRVMALKSLFEVDEVIRETELQKQIWNDIETTQKSWDALWNRYREKYGVTSELECKLNFDFTTGELFYYEEEEQST